jgi:hypothetical protein
MYDYVGDEKSGLRRMFHSHYLSDGQSVTYANAGQNGTGGTIVVSTHGAGNAVTIGGGSGSTRLSALGGTVSGDGGSINVSSDDAVTVPLNTNLIANARQTGSGGSVSVTSGAPLTINSKSIAVTAAANGNGGSISLTGSSLKVIGDVHADGSGTGNGGQIGLTSRAADYTLDGTSNLYARSGQGGGHGGTISASAGGNLTVLSKAILNTNVRGEDGTGGNITLTGGTLGAGGLTIDSNLNVNGAGSGSGGNITVSSAASGSAGSIIVNGNLTAKDGAIFFKAVDQLKVDASGKLTGKVQIEGLNIDFTSTCDNQHLTLGDVTAAQGDALIAVTGAASDIELVAGATITAVGNQTAQAGSVTLKTTRNITIDEGAKVIVNGVQDQNAGTINLTAGTSGDGILKLDGDLLANGLGIGNAGTINLTYTSGATLRIGINGAVVANADPNGSGLAGEVSFTDNKEADMSLDIEGTVSTESPSGTPATIRALPCNVATFAARIKVGGTGSINGDFDVTALNIDFKLENPNTSLEVDRLNAPFGSVKVTCTNPNQSIKLIPGGFINALNKVELTTNKLVFAAQSAYIQARDSISITGITGLEIDGPGSIQNAVPAPSPLTIDIKSPTGDIHIDQVGINAKTLIAPGSIIQITAQTGNIYITKSVLDASSLDYARGIYIKAKNGQVTTDSTTKLIDTGFLNSEINGAIWMVAKSLDLAGNFDSSGAAAGRVNLNCTGTARIAATINANHLPQSGPQGAPGLIEIYAGALTLDGAKIFSRGKGAQIILSSNNGDLNINSSNLEAQGDSSDQNLNGGITVAAHGGSLKVDTGSSLKSANGIIILNCMTNSMKPDLTIDGTIDVNSVSSQLAGGMINLLDPDGKITVGSTALVTSVGAALNDPKLLGGIIKLNSHSIEIDGVVQVQKTSSRSGVYMQSSATTVTPSLSVIGTGSISAPTIRLTAKFIDYAVDNSTGVFSAKATSANPDTGTSISIKTSMLVMNLSDITSTTGNIVLQNKLEVGQILVAQGASISTKGGSIALIVGADSPNFITPGNSNRPSEVRLSGTLNHDIFFRGTVSVTTPSTQLAKLQASDSAPIDLDAGSGSIMLGSGSTIKTVAFVEQLDRSKPVMASNQQVGLYGDACVLDGLPGELVIDARNSSLQLISKGFTVVMRRGDCILVKRSYDGSTSVNCLSNRAYSGIRVNNLQLKPGQAVVLANSIANTKARLLAQQAVAVRSLSYSDTAVLCEVALPSLFSTSRALKMVRHASDKRSDACWSRIQKDWVCSSTITSGHGAYKYCGE